MSWLVFALYLSYALGYLFVAAATRAAPAGEKTLLDYMGRITIVLAACTLYADSHTFTGNEGRRLYWAMLLSYWAAYLIMTVVGFIVQTGTTCRNIPAPLWCIIAAVVITLLNRACASFT